MIRLPASLLRLLIRLGFKPWVGPPFPFGFQRLWLRLMSSVNRPARSCAWRELDMGGLRALEAKPRQRAPRPVVLYLHGGGYCVGSWGTHLGLITHLAVRADATVYAPNYRLAPEDPHPAALHDAVGAYRWLLDRGVPAADVILAGDSAGGGLALATAMSVRDAELPPPAGLVLLSPWVDLTGDSESMRRNAHLDPMLRPSWSRQCARAYLGGRPATDPACSPLFARHEGLPPVLIQVGSDELILDDSTRLADRCREAGLDVNLHQYEGMWHDFQLHAGALDTADRALDEIAAFIADAMHELDSRKDPVHRVGVGHAFDRG